jgi:hypothetical protein
VLAFGGIVMKPTDGHNPCSPRSDALIHLDPWEEVTGKLEDIDVGGHYCTVELSPGRIRLPGESRAAERLIEELDEIDGASVAIIRTDAKSDQYRVRVSRGAEDSS